MMILPVFQRKKPLEYKGFFINYRRQAPVLEA
jgi:hypothetical protein